jgi:hypothetical protein
VHAPRDKPYVRGFQFNNLSIDTTAAAIMALLIAVPSPLSVNLSYGGVIGLAMAPVTLPALWRNARGRWLLIATVALVPMGWLVAQTSVLQDNGRTFNTQIFLYQAALPVGLLASMVGAYWCITKLGLQRFMLLSFAGLLAAALLSYDPTNPWKYGLALPVSMLVTLLVARNRLLLVLVVAPLLAAVSIAADFRSWIAILGMATALVVFARNSWTPPSASKVASYGLVALAGGVMVGALVVQASAAGMLGDELERRTTSQLKAANGNLILGGRPEWGAATALWRETPLGIGLGVTPSSDDYWLAIRHMPLRSEGLQELSVVAKSFQQGVVSFHSTFLTFWAVYGVAGVIFSVLALVYLAHAMMVTAVSLRRPNLRAAVALLMLSSIWDILFSPTIAAQLGVALATASYLFGEPDIAPILRRDSQRERSSAH